MLRITYTPPGADPRLFEMASFEDTLGAKEAELVENAGDLQWDSFMGWTLRMTEGSIRACRVLLWILLRRENPELKLDDLDFPVSALQIEDTGDDRPCRVCGKPEADAQHAGENSHKYEPPAEPEGKDGPGDSATSSP